MFWAKKIYCRCYQQIFHIAIPFLPYRKPKILQGIAELPTLLHKKKITSLLLVTDASIRSFGLTAPLEKLLADEGIECIVYDKTVANPTTVNVAEALELYKENNCEALIGFGGGSSIDCAKAAGARIARPGKELSDMEGILKVGRKLPLLIAIPTTAGTGSETRSLPPSLTATTGMDALTHAVEAYIGRSTTAGTRKDSIRAVQLIFKYIRTAYNDGNDMRARKQMLYAAYLAGSAFTKSYVGYVHAVAHSLGGRYNTPHGLANAVLLPHVLEAYGESAAHKLCRLAICAGLADAGTPDDEGAAIFIEAIRQMKEDLNIPDVIPEIKEEDIPELARFADKEANPLYPVPKLMNASELEKFYYCVMSLGQAD